MEIILTELAKFGLPGLVIAYLIWQNHSLADRLEKAQLRIESLHDKRVLEAAESSKVLGESAASNEKMAEAMSSISQAVTRLDARFDASTAIPARRR